MLPIDKLKFTMIEKEGEKILLARLKWEEYMRLTPLDSKDPQRVEWTKDNMRRNLWWKTYGELTDLFNQLACHARYSALPEYVDDVNRLTKQIEALISFPSTTGQPPIQPETDQTSV